jgi:hypothetical protein
LNWWSGAVSSALFLWTVFAWTSFSVLIPTPRFVACLSCLVTLSGGPITRGHPRALNNPLGMRTSCERWRPESIPQSAASDDMTSEFREMRVPEKNIRRLFSQYSVHGQPCATPRVHTLGWLHRPAYFLVHPGRWRLWNILMT